MSILLNQTNALRFHFINKYTFKKPDLFPKELVAEK